MKKRLLGLKLIAVLFLFAGCSSAPVVQPTDTRVTARKTIAFEVSQRREFAASKRQTFDATHAVMENAGYLIETANYDAGVLNGKVPVVTIDRLLLEPVSKSVSASAFVDGGPEMRTRVRIDFVSTLDAPRRTHANGLIIEGEGVSDLAIYQRIFDEIQEMLYP
jgi:hypothetical protein